MIENRTKLLFFFVFFGKLTVRRWRIMLIIAIVVLIPILLIQYLLLQDQDNIWNRFDERILLEQSGEEFKTNQILLFRNIVFKKLKRPADYCNLPLAKLNEDENHLGEEWQLRNLFTVLRHGQRSSGFNMLGTNYEFYINCSIRQFPTFKNSDWKKFLRYLDPKISRYHLSDICQENRLTLLGVLQIFIFGTRYQSAYSRFLKKGKLNNQINVHTTSYNRTKLTAQIIHYLMNKDNKPVENIDESSNIMFCKPNSSIQCKCDSLKYYYSKFNRYQKLWEHKNLQCKSIFKKFNRVFSNDHKQQTNRSKEPRNFYSFNALFDIVSVAVCASDLEIISREDKFCWPRQSQILNQEPWPFMYKSVQEDEYVDMNANMHNNSLRLNHTIPSGHIYERGSRCLSLNLLNNLWKCMDLRRDLLTQNLDFLKYAKLVAYPFWKRIVDRIESSKHSNSYSRKKERSEQINLHNTDIYVGHDLTLQYLLASLDFIPSTNESISNLVNSKPGFASRLVLEVYSQKSKSRSKRAISDQDDDNYENVEELELIKTNKTTKPGRTSKNPKPVSKVTIPPSTTKPITISPPARVRFLYNGIDLSPWLTFCRNENGNHICKWTDFSEYIVTKTTAHNEYAYWHHFQTSDYKKECQKGS